MNNLKSLRIAKGLSQQALAKKLGCSQQSIHKYENHITEPDFNMLKTMADFFDVSIDYLVGYSSYAHKVETVQETDLNEDELILLRKYRSLTPSSKKVLQQLIDEWLQNLQGA